MTDIIEVTPTFEQYAFTFGGVAPMRKIAPGTVLRLWSDDAFCGALRSVTDLSSEKVDLRFVNPQTGPFYVEGAEPGDTLALHLVSLEPARDWGASAAIPFFGGLTSTDRTVMLQEALPDTTWIYHLDSVARTVQFQARHSEHRIDLPLEPMLGTVGVAPASNEVRSSLVPDRFGGNMDARRCAPAHRRHRTVRAAKHPAIISRGLTHDGRDTAATLTRTPRVPAPAPARRHRQDQTRRHRSRDQASRVPRLRPRRHRYPVINAIEPGLIAGVDLNLVPHSSAG